MNRKIVPFIVLLLVLMGGGAYYRQKNSGGSGKEVTIYGNVEIRQVTLAFRVGGRVAQVKVDEGAIIRQGDLLASLDTQPLENALRGAQGAVASLLARNSLLHNGYRTEEIRQAKNRVEATRAAVTETQRQWIRQRDLAGEGAVTQRALEGAESQRDQAQAQADSAGEQLRLVAGGFRKEELAESDAQLSQARAGLDAAKLALADASLTAPASGVIITRAVEQGSMVQSGTPAFSLSLTKPVWARAYVGEAQMGRFPSGAKVNLTTDSQPGKNYRGVVGFVSPTAEFTPKSVETTDLRTSLVYRLRIVVENPDEQLRQGMPVTVRLGR